MTVKSGSAVRALLACVAGVAVALSAGCNDAEKNRPSTTMPVSRHPSLGLREVPDYLKGTIFERADMKDIAPFRVSGYGLVAGLRGTGDNSAIPQRVREYMVKEMLKNGFDSHATGMQGVTPEMVLRDNRFAVVQVDGLIPPGARKYDPDAKYNDRFDIYISAMEESYTKSLSHGSLYTTNLRIMGANPRNPSGSVNTYAVAAGPVFVNPAYALTPSKSTDAVAQASLRYGVVMDGGISQIDNALVIRIRDPQYSTARAIERRINERFQSVADKTNVVGQLAMAAAVDDGIVKVYVPRWYQGDWQHFAGIVKHLYMRGEPGYLAQMAQKLADAAVLPDAPLENISYAWEGIGAPAEPVLRKMMHHPQQDVAYAAARAAAFILLEDAEEPRNVLMTMAKTPDHPFRINAVRTLGAMPVSPETSQAVRQLLSSDNNMVRIEAYKALVKGHDARVFTKVVQEKFALDLLPSSGAPLIYASSRGIPRIAVFGMRQSMVTPVTFSAFDSRLTVTADKAGGPVTLFYRSEAAAGDRSTGTIRQQSQPDLAELLARLGGEAGEDEKRLDFSYSDVVALLQVMHKDSKLVGASLDGTEVPITLVIEEGNALTRDAILSAPQIPETERLNTESDEVSAPQIPDSDAAPAPTGTGQPPSPLAEPAGKGRAN